MTNILTAAEGANFLRCETTDALMLQLLPMVDDYIETATGRQWELDTTIEPRAKAAAGMLLVKWHENPAMVGNMDSLSHGLTAALTQLEARAEELLTSGIATEALKIMASIPWDGMQDLAITANLVLAFNNQVPSGATSCAALKTMAGATVASANSLDVTGKILTINPTASLTAATQYQVVLTDLPDVYGQTLTETISFWTA